MEAKQMTHREIATKILAVMDLYEKSWVKTGISWDRAGNKHEEGYHTKTRNQCFQEIFGDESFLYEPYRILIQTYKRDLEHWVNCILKMG